jgi:hypothetical protein
MTSLNALLTCVFLGRIWRAVLIAPVATLHSHQGRVGCLYRKLRRSPRSPLEKNSFSAEMERTCLQRAPLWTRNQLTRCNLGALCVRATQTTSAASGGLVHELKPINCLANTRAPNPDAMLQIGGSGMLLGQVGGKRVVAPKVTGAGVTSKQPSRLPPRAAVVCLDDVDVSAHRDQPSCEPPQRSPTGDGELPSLPVPDR